MITRLSVACGSFLMLASVLCAADSSSSLQPLTTRVEREPVPTLVPIYRAYVDAGGDNKFAFLLPEGFRLAGDPGHGRLEINDTEHGYFITFTISSGPELSRDTHMEALSRRFPKGKVMPETVMPVLGRNCQAFGVEWKSSGELYQKTRVVYVPTSAGMLEASLTCGGKDFPKAVAALNQVLGSLTASVDGKLTIHHIAGQN